ncbi:MAG: peroxidase [Actinomycetota bacterium]|nr:peroxidase [Actinomycetota bacterium]
MVHHGDALARESGDASLTETVVSGRLDALGPRLAAMCRYALKLTVQPDAVRADDLEPLREVELSDRDIVDLNQVVAYFNYVNRIADGLGVELEDHWPADVPRSRTYRLGGKRPPTNPAG